MTARKLKILIVDDSAFMRLLISDILSEDSQLEVVGSAVNGMEAAAKVEMLKPDLVLLDMNMPDYDGIYAVKRIMSENPLPILILSSIGNTDLEPIFEALKLGAVDYMNKPGRGNAKMRTLDLELITKIKSVARAEPRVIKTAVVPVRLHTFRESSQYGIIAIGASTGGPSALEKVISSFPSNLTVPVVIAQHMPANFIRPFIRRLNALSQLEVVLGRKSMVPRPGMIIIAPGDANMIFEENPATGEVEVSFCHEVYRDYNNPSINAMMQSVADVYGKRAVGVILTGMGKDGVKGLKAIRERGGLTIAQDRESSVIYGMPKVAMETAAAATVLDINEIGKFIINSL